MSGCTVASIEVTVLNWRAPDLHVLTLGSERGGDIQRLRIGNMRVIPQTEK
jgi:hypothetical protein